MVQGALIKTVIDVVTRILILLVVLFLSAFTSDPAHDFILNIFHYQNPSGFFAASWAEWSIAWVLTSVFWSGIIFGAIGKKIDYIFNFVIILFALWEYIGAENVTPQMYLGLIGVALLGNALGYALKIGRKNWFGK